MSEIRKVHHYHTKTPNNNPLATNMVDGEIAINMAAGSEKLFIKNTNEQIVEFLPVDKLQEKLTSGESIKTINNESILGNGNVNVGEIVARDTSETLDDVYGNIDLTPYATKVDLNNKQDRLISGSNIKTINGETILGTGDIVIESGSGDGVLIVEDETSLESLDVPVGSLAVVGKEGSGRIASFRDLAPFTMDNIDMNTGILTANGLDQVGGIQLYTDNIINTNGKQYLLYLVSDNTNLMTPNPDDIIAGILFTGDGTKMQINGMIMDPSVGEINHILYDPSAGLNQSELDNFNSYLANNVLYSTCGLESMLLGADPYTSEDFDIIDSIIMAGSGTPTKSDVYVKNDAWEKIDYKSIPKVVSDVETLNKSVETLKKNTNYPFIELDSGDSYPVLNPNTYSHLIVPSNRNNEYYFYFNTGANTEQIDEYVLELDCTNKVVTFSFASSIKWANDEAPTFNVGKKYLFSFINNLGMWAEF